MLSVLEARDSTEAINSIERVLEKRLKMRSEDTKSTEMGN